MEIVVQIIVGIVVGIVALGLLVFLFRHIFNRLDLKVDKDVFIEYTKRISDSLETGNRRFDKIDSGLNKISNDIRNLCVALEKHNRG
jgi:hypothetical protein